MIKLHISYRAGPLSRTQIAPAPQKYRLHHRLPSPLLPDRCSTLTQRWASIILYLASIDPSLISQDGWIPLLPPLVPSGSPVSGKSWSEVNLQWHCAVAVPLLSPIRPGKSQRSNDKVSPDAPRYLTGEMTAVLCQSAHFGQITSGKNKAFV